jgi:asparagine synthase (glutamine-hydrolysing)
MCGICGIFNFCSNEPVDPSLLRNMRDTMRHRGPDEEGLYVKGNLGLGHRRLSIIDLSTGQQPMSNEACAEQGRSNSTVWIVYNGEVYNYLELKEDLEKKGHRFRTRSDTETIIHLYEEYGERCVEHLRGMFAFAIWDEKRQRLLLARDRLGKKPLHYYLDDQRLIFASELKAILQDRTVLRQIDLVALREYLAYQYVPGSKTIFEGIKKVPPAHVLVCSSGQTSLRQYWHLIFREDHEHDEAYYVDRLKDLLSEAVRLRLVSDVPLGAFLSGGIDSSTVVALMSQASGEPVKTFSIGFEEQDFSELRYARLVAQRFQTDHHEFIVRPNAVELLPRLAWQYDEPFADVSAIPTFYVSQMARQHVTVCLSGDGGDEAFAGYGHYIGALGINQRYRLLDRIPLSWRRQIFGRLHQNWPAGLRGYHMTRKVSMSFAERFAEQISCFNLPEQVHLLSADVLKTTDNRFGYDAFLESDSVAKSWPAISRLQYIDFTNYLPDDILVKVDKASMLNSLEVRVPLLDHKVIEFIASMPGSLRLRNGERKYIFKKIARQLLPAEVLQRPKMGFSTPVNFWFRGELADYAREVLLDRRTMQRGFFNRDYIEGLISQPGPYRDARSDWGHQVWTLLCLEHWCRAYLDGG